MGDGTAVDGAGTRITCHTCRGDTMDGRRGALVEKLGYGAYWLFYVVLSLIHI